jgi:hypothetical protein
VGIVNLGYAAFVIFAHLALCAAAIRRLPAAEIVRFGFGVSLSSLLLRPACLLRQADPAATGSGHRAPLATLYVNPTKRVQSCGYAV